ncbi:MAG TPA: molybdopterin cofactor-binding domain-containing protein [Burkholderiales bacterium]|jgi:isoquinoline 1-oxidoreductase beta subunit|nr:molybdopterin cofactor-binding domain-containing protein [Burkholderiales bacterium]
MRHWIENYSHSVTRRDFLKGAAAGGFVVGLHLSPLGKSHPFSGIGAAQAAEGVELPQGAFMPNVFVAIDKKGIVTVVCHRSEMGQGIRTGIPQIVADELEADWSRVRVVQAEGDSKKYGNQYTDGSRSIRHNLQRMREFGAVTRTMLEQAAAIKMGVKAAECKAVNHRVVHVPSGRAMDYGQLVDTAATLKIPSVKDVQLKDPANFRYIGKPVDTIDGPDIVTGRAIFGIDKRLPGMLYAVVEHCPVTYGKVKSFDASEALKVPGVVRVVELPQTQPPIVFNTLGGIAIVAKNTWAAEQGRKKLKIEWDYGPNVVYNSDKFKEEMAQTARSDAKVVRQEGDAVAAMGRASKVIEADFYVPHYAHATMEPPAAIAHYKDGKCEVWSACQDGQAARSTVAGALGIDEKNVTSYVTLLGGAFGRKSKPDFAAEAALLSKQMGAPVRVTWTREDDLQHAYYHTVCAQHVKAGLDENGRCIAWHHRNVFPTIWSTFEKSDPEYGHKIEFSLGYIDMPYAIPNLRLENGKAKAHVRIGWLRSVNNIPNAFVQNTVANMLAYEAGRDPYDYLLELIGPDRVLDLSSTDYWNYDQTYDEYPIMTWRLKNVLRMAAAQAGYGRKLPEREAIGLAVHRSFTTYVATAVHVRVSKDGKVSIPRVDVAYDAGLVVNPDRAKAQMEGACIYGMSAAWACQITAKNGVIEQKNFPDYPVVRIMDAPREIHVHQVLAGDYPPGGIGEPGVPPFIPALTNAIFAATGKRITELPISKYDLSA